MIYTQNYFYRRYFLSTKVNLFCSLAKYLMIEKN